MKLDWPDLPELFPGPGEPDVWLPLLERHAALVAAAAPRVRVTAVPREDEVRRQYAESLEIGRLAGLTELGPGARVVDVGSGGGFPGMVLAIAWPHLSFVLVEPLQKRAALLRSMARELGLDNVEVVASRAEDAGRGPLRETAAVVTARAVAELRVLLEYTAPFARPGGLVALPKGSSLVEELEAAAGALDQLGLVLVASRPMRPEVADRGSVVVFRKVGTLDARFPRRAGQPARRPLGEKR